VLFDFIEEAHERGAPLCEWLLDAGILRLRLVLIKVGATVIERRKDEGGKERSITSISLRVLRLFVVEIFAPMVAA